MFPPGVSVVERDMTITNIDVDTEYIDFESAMEAIKTGKFSKWPDDNCPKQGDKQFAYAWGQEVMNIIVSLGLLSR